MPTKSYTLADGSTATVTATENGVPFNEGMQALTKAIKARVAVRDGSGTGGASGKLVPTITWGTLPSNSPSIYEGNIEYTLDSDTPTVLAGYYITDGENDSLQPERFNDLVYTRVLYLTTKNAAIPVSVHAGAGDYWCHLFVAAEETDNYEAAVFRNEFHYED